MPISLNKISEILIGLFSVCCVASAEIHPACAGLKVQSIIEPIGIGTPNLDLSWQRHTWIHADSVSGIGSFF